MDLLADIGGTNARVAFREGNVLVGGVHLRRSADFASLGLLLRDVIDKAGQNPRRAAVAVAGPVTGDIVKLTNLPWSFSTKELAGELGLARLLVENDVAALAWAVPGTGTADLLALTPDLTPPTGPKLVIAPGTGLGMAALVPMGPARWLAVPSEGGHAHVAPAAVLSKDERAALWRADDMQNWVPSWEDFLSGIGLPRLYRAFGGGDGPAEDITARATGGEAAAVSTMKVFSKLLGAFAGDATLILGARGGCYIGGGLLSSIGKLFEPALFLEGFRAKERFADYMSGIPAFILKHPHAALLGLGYLLDQDLLDQD